MDELDQLRDSLLRGRPNPRRPDQGEDAFERHQLLAIRFHRAAKVNSGDRGGEGEEWRGFFNDHFPRGGEHGQLLWKMWRTALLKAETPGDGVAITHNRPDAHWRISDRGLVIDLESIWEDYATSVESMISMFRTDDARREVGLAWWNANQWRVETITIPVVIRTSQAVSASVPVGPMGVQATAMAGTPPLPKQPPDDSV